MPMAEQVAVAARAVEIDQILIYTQKISVQALESENERLTGENKELRNKLRHTKNDVTFIFMVSIFYALVLASRCSK